VIGTAAMTAAQELSAKLMSSGGGGEEPSDPWEQASTPAKVARKLSNALLDKDPPPESIPTLTNVMHWAYGTSWGAAYGLAHGTAPDRPLRRGLAFGAFVWAMSYVELVPMGLYQPPWEYGAQSIALEVGYHLAYGTGVGAGHRLLPGP
jgi:hypothetical protein